MSTLPVALLNSATPDGASVSQNSLPSSLNIDLMRLLITPSGMIWVLPNLFFLVLIWHSLLLTVCIQMFPRPFVQRSVTFSSLYFSVSPIS